MEKKPRYTLGKKERLKSRKAIEQIFAAGQGFSMFPFRVTWMVVLDPGNANQEMPLCQPPTINHQPILQVAFSVPRRQFKRAVDRNRIKRLMREAWRLQKVALKESLQAKGLQLRVFLIFTGRELPPWPLVQEKILQVINRLQKIVHEKPADPS